MRLDRLMAPKSIAIFGASENPSPGRRILDALAMLGYPGEVFPINPKYETVVGRRCYPSIAALPSGVDAIVFCVNHELVLKPFREAAAHGIGGAVILDHGFAEKGEEGRKMQAEIVATARDAGMAVCGPNCMGILSPHHRTSLYTGTLVDKTPVPGNVGLIAQSGSIAIGLLTDCRRFGFSHIVTAGNEAVTCTADYIDYLCDDPNTRVIATFTETVRNPDRYVAALDKAASRGKPVVVLKVGRSERSARAISSHTGGLAGESRVFSEVLRRHRAIEVRDLEEMTEVLACCQGSRWPKGRNIGIVTASGGQAELILDIAADLGLSLPPLSDAGKAEVARVIGPISGDGNPLDAWGNGKFQTNMPHGIQVMTNEPDIDAVVLISDTNDGQPMAPTRYTPFLAEASRKTDRPCFFMNSRHGLFRREFMEKLREDDVVVISGIRSGLGAIDRLARWNTPAPAGRSPRPMPSPHPAALMAGSAAARRSINEVDAKRLLATAGLPVVPERLVADARSAQTAARAIGYPVVLKAVSDDIPHKTEFGLVAVDLRDDDALAAAFTSMSGRIAALSKPPRDLTWTVQKMIAGGIEVFAGVSRDPDFGLTIAFGLGGVMIDVLQEFSLRMLPLRSGDAEAMVDGMRAARLLAGLRGAPAADVPAVVDCLYRLADFAWENRERLDEIDLNPVIVLPKGAGCIIVDALIVPRRTS